MTDVNKEMIMVTEMPTSGQFATVHEFAGLLWGSTYKWEDDELYCFKEGTDEWVEVDSFESEHAATNVLGYFVKVV
jgi:hypothetical protein